MNSKKNKMRYELPDYVQGKISDEKLLHKIEDEIKSDKDFMEEYISIKSFFGQQMSINEREAPQGYYSTLLPEILNKAEQKKNKKGFSFILNWRLATIFTVIILSVIFYRIGIFTPGNDKLNTFIQHDSMNNLTTQINDSIVPESDANVKENTGIVTTTQKSKYKKDNPADDFYDLLNENEELMQDYEQEEPLDDVVKDLSDSKLNQLLNEINNLNL
jgi:hypothetical protein